MIQSSASIVGVGAVTSLGRNVEEIAQNLYTPPVASTGTIRVDDHLIAEPAIQRRMRRADRFARMAAVAAMDAWNAAKLASAGIPMEKIGLIVTSGFGPHGRGFRFLDGILDCGDSDALPTDFSHSVHGAAAAYITELLELRGPCLSTTDFEIGFEQAILLAQCWLGQGVCDRVIVGAVEELGEVLIHCAGRMLDGDPRFVPGEGAVFVTLARADVAGLARVRVANQSLDSDLLIVDVPALGPSHAPTLTPSTRCLTTFSPYFGHTPSSSAFQLLGGLLSITAGRPLGQLIQSAGAEPRASRVDNVATLQSSLNFSGASLLLTKP